MSLSIEQYNNTPRGSKIFISYSHDSLQHKERVLQLSNRLRTEGVDCNIDQYEISPSQGWPRWMNDQIEEADFVLVVCTENYEKRFRGKDEAGRGLGSSFEGLIITQELYEAAKNTQFIPIVFSSEDSNYIPIILKSATRYNLDTEEAYIELYARLTTQTLVTKPDLGKVRHIKPFEKIISKDTVLNNSNQKPVIGELRNITTIPLNIEHPQAPSTPPQIPNKREIIVDLISLFEKGRLYGVGMSHHEATDLAISVYNKIPERTSDFKKLFSFFTENKVGLLGFTLNMTVSDATNIAIRIIEEITSDKIDGFIELILYAGEIKSLGLGLSQADSIEFAMKRYKDIPIERINEFKDLVSFATGKGLNFSSLSSLNLSIPAGIEFAVTTIKEVPSDMISEFKNLILSARGYPFSFSSTPGMTTSEAIDYARRTIKELM